MFKRFLAAVLAPVFFSAAVHAQSLALKLTQGTDGSGNYFTRAMNALILPTGFLSAMEIQCPSSDAQTNSTYAYFPLNLCVTNNIDYMVTTSTETLIPVDQFPWGNRWTETGTRNTRPNQIYGQTVRLRYSSKAIADAATTAEIAASLGYGAHVSGASCPTAPNPCGYLDITEAAGIADGSVYTYANFVASVLSTCTIAYAGFTTCPVDTVVLTQNYIANMPTAPIHGITLDWEPADGHTASETTAIMTAIAALVHKKNSICQAAACVFSLYTNPLDSATSAARNGFVGTGNVDANTDTILGIVDLFGIQLFHGTPGGSIPTSLTRQIAMFAAPSYSKMFIIWDLQNGVTAASSVRTSITVTHVWNGVHFWRDYTTQGGPCSTVVNQQIGNLVGVAAC